MADFRFIDLFAGIGGFRLGFQRAGGECVFTSEIDPHARKTYAVNHGVAESDIYGDITKIDPHAIPAHDVLLAGFPCQAFSPAGHERGFADTRGTLFFEIARILAAGRTNAFCLENVPRLLTHDNGKTFSVMSAAIRDLGFHLSLQVVNAAAWVPQRRKRVFLCGHQYNPAFNIDFLQFPDPESGPKLGSILERGDPPGTRLTDAEWTAAKEHKSNQSAQGRGFGCNVVAAGQVGPTLTTRNVETNEFVIDELTLSDTFMGHLEKENRTRGNITHICGDGDVGNTLIAQYQGSAGASAVLVEQPGRNPRRLSARECARYMGFPDTFQIPVSRSAAYKLFGNSIVPQVAEHIATHLKAEI